MDIRMNTEWEEKLTPKDDKLLHSQNVQMPIHLKEDLNVELTLMDKYEVIALLHFSNYTKVIFAQRKDNGTLSLLVYLSIFNSLIADEYTNSKITNYCHRWCLDQGLFRA